MTPAQTQPPAKQFAESLSGLIERVTFFNEESGRAVLKVKAKGHRDQVTVIGSNPSVSVGEWVTAEGRWIQDREFGLQFKAEMLNSTAPTTKEGIEKYPRMLQDPSSRLEDDCPVSQNLRASTRWKRDRL